MAQAKVLNEKEIRKVLLYIAAHKHAQRNRAMFQLLHLTGMRVGELAALRLCDVLTKDAEITDEIRLSRDQTKGDKPRTVLLSDKARQELCAYLRIRFDTKDLAPILLTDTTRALFNTQKSAHRGFSANTLAQHFHILYKRAGITGASSHSGRRGFITGLAEQGVSARVLQMLAGHSSLATTQRYIDINPAMMRKAVELI
jgi:integrase/recombinase XerD